MTTKNFLADNSGKAIKGELFTVLQKYTGLESTELEHIIEKGLVIPGKGKNIHLEVEELIQIGKVISQYTDLDNMRCILEEEIFPDHPDETFYTKLTYINDKMVLKLHTRGWDDVEFKNPIMKSFEVDVNDSRRGMNYFYIYKPKG